MSDYQRLVSYIYSYPGGTRDKNVGFAKAEVRNGQFKLNVSLKGVYTDTPETFGVHLMVEDRAESAGGFALLPVGNVIVNGGAGQYADLLNPENISGSGYRFEDISGIAVARQDNSYYRMFSLWKDVQIKPELIKFLPKDYKKFDKAEKEKRLETDETVKNAQELGEENAGNIKEAGVVAAESVSESAPVGIAGGVSENVSRSAAEIGSEHVLRGVSENVSENVSRSAAELGSERVLRGASEDVSKNVSKNVSKSTSEGENSFVQSSGENSKSESNMPVDDTRNADICAADAVKISKTQKPVPGEMGGIFDNADFIDAFGDDYYYDCVEVTPEQLQKLPIEDKAVVSNSFLEHGYYNFKHLLFGKVRENERHTKYFIGVPGMYCNRERFMATMFGYGNFKRSHRADCSNPYFGYWYQEI